MIEGSVNCRCKSGGLGGGVRERGVCVWPSSDGRCVLAMALSYSLLSFFLYFVVRSSIPFVFVFVWMEERLLSFHLALIFLFRLFFSLQADTSTAQENKVTVTLIAVVILFLVCQTPNAIQLIYTMNVTEHSNMGRGERFVRFLVLLFFC